MVGIGMSFAADTEAQPNIEDTLLDASIEAMERGDLRVLSVLATWFGVHASWVNADRLIKLVGEQKSPRLRALWSALARWQGRDRRFARLIRLYRGKALDLLAVGTDFQIHRHGEDPRFEGTALRVPANVLRDRAADALTPVELAQRHRAYRWRVTMGPGYRADMWAALELDSHLSASELARRTYGSFATAWNVRRAFAMVTGRPARISPRSQTGDPTPSRPRRGRLDQFTHSSPLSGCRGGGRAATGAAKPRGAGAGRAGPREAQGSPRASASR